MSSIREAVAETLGNLSDRTRSQVVEHFAQIEATRQATALIKGLDKLHDHERELKKINRPDIKTFNEDGSVASEAFSSERIEQRKKLNEQIEKLTKAITKADDTNEFSDLYNLTK